MGLSQTKAMNHPAKTKGPSTKQRVKQTGSESDCKWECSFPLDRITGLSHQANEPRPVERRNYQPIRSVLHQPRGLWEVA